MCATTGTRVTLAPVTKSAENPLFVEDKPWEGANRNTYPTAAFDSTDGKYKLWYNTNTRCAPNSHGGYGFCPHLGYNKDWLPTVMGEQRTATLYAESNDGLSWVKPSLGLVSWNGSTENSEFVDTGWFLSSVLFHEQGTFTAF